MDIFNNIKAEFTPLINNDEYTASFWSSGQRGGNPLHEISYRACFKAELPEFFIRRFSKEGDTVYDPFMGRGTTILEGALLNRKTIGNDINPLSQMLIEPRLNNIDVSSVESRLEDMDLTGASIKGNEDLLAFYHPDTLSEIIKLKEILSSPKDMTDKWIKMVSLNRLTGHSSGFFSGYTLPPNQAVSVASQLKINEKRGISPPIRDIKKIILKKTKSLLSRKPIFSADYLLTVEDARHNENVKDNSVDLIITSPPFLDVIDYDQDNWLRLWFAGLEKKGIGKNGKQTVWRDLISLTLKDCYRVLHKDGYCCMEVGNVRKGKVDLKECVREEMIKNGFQIRGVIVNKQNFSKTSSIWGIDNNAKGTNIQYIVVGQK